MKRYWLIAAAGVVVAWVLLSQEPAEPPPAAREGTAAAGGEIIELPSTVADDQVATVDLGSELAQRFAAEQPDPAWAARAALTVETQLALALAQHGAQLTARECRRTVCRLEVTYSGAPPIAARTDAVIEALEREGHDAVLERVSGSRATFLSAVRI